MTKQYVIDIETNGMVDTFSKIWCISVGTTDSDKVITFSNYSHNTPWDLDSFAGFLSKYMNEEQEWIMHNGITYDLPILKKWFYGFSFENIKVIDTLVMSRYLNPDRIGGHSLKAWAKRVMPSSEQKVEQEYWDKFDENMLTRCESDVKITKKTYIELCKELKINEEKVKVCQQLMII